MIHPPFHRVYGNISGSHTSQFRPPRGPDRLPESIPLPESILSNLFTVMVHLVHLIHTPPTISDHLQLHLPTLRCHSDAHCVSSHNHATPVARLNSDQCLISLDLVPMSRAAAYLSFSPYAAFA